MQAGQSTRLLIAAVGLVLFAACSEPSPSTPDVVQSSPPASVEFQPTSIATERPTAIATPRVIDLLNNLPYASGGGAIPPGALARIGIGEVMSIIPIPALDQLLIATTTGLYMYRLSDLSLIWRFYHDVPLYESDEVSVVRDNTRIVVGYNWDGGLIYDAATGVRIAKLQGYAPPSVSPDGSLAAVEQRPDDPQFSQVGYINVYDVNTGVLFRRLEAPINGFYGHTFGKFQWSGNGRYVMTCVVDTQQRFIWDIETGQQVLAEPCFTETEFGPAGALLVEVKRDTTITDIATGTTISIPKALSVVGWRGDTLFSVSDLTLESYDTQTWELKRTFQLVNEGFWLNLSRAGDKFTIKTDDGYYIVDSETFTKLYLINFNKYLEWSPNDRWLFNAPHFEVGSFTLIDGNTGGNPLYQVRRVDSSTFIGDEKVVVRAGGNISILDALSGSMIIGLWAGPSTIAQSDANPVREISWSTDGIYLKMATDNNEVYWSKDTNQLTNTYAGSTGFADPTPIVIAPMSSYNIPIISTSPDNRIRAEGLSDFFIGDGPIGGGGLSSQLNLYRGSDTTAFFTSSDTHNLIRALTWTSDSSRLAVGYGGGNNRIDVLEAQTGATLFTFEGHLGFIIRLSFSPDGKLLASASKDGSIIVWATP